MTTKTEDRTRSLLGFRFIGWLGPNAQAAPCQHKRYAVDAHKQTGRCIDCGSEGRVKFVEFKLAAAMSDAEIVNLRYKAVRVLAAWDSTLLLKNHDPLMRESMERLRTALTDFEA